MKKVLLLVAVGLVLAYAGTAGALTLQVGFNQAKYTDVSHIYDLPPVGGPAPGGVPIDKPAQPPADPSPLPPGVPAGPYPILYPGGLPPALPNPPLVGPFQDPAHAGWIQENRAVFNVTDIFIVGQPPPAYFNPSAQVQLSGLFYDFEILSVTPAVDILGNQLLIINMGALGRNPLVADIDGDSVGGITGGVVELWLDDPAGAVPVASDYSVLAGPAAWTEADAGVGGRDSYPTINQSGESLWLSFAFTDLGGPGTVPGTVFQEVINLTTGEGHGIGYGNVFGGSAEGQIGRNGFGLSPSGVPRDVSFESDYKFAPHLAYNPSVNPTAAAGWLNSSEDPVHFFVPIPEPLTLMGLTLGVAGLGGYIRKRRMA